MSEYSPPKNRLTDDADYGTGLTISGKFYICCAIYCVRPIFTNR